MYNKYMGHYKENRDRLHNAIDDCPALSEIDKKAISQFLQEGYLYWRGVRFREELSEARKTAELTDGRHFAVVSRERAAICKNEIFIGEDGSRYRVKREISGFDIIEPNDVETIVGTEPFDITKLSRVLKVQEKEES